MKVRIDMRSLNCKNCGSPNIILSEDKTIVTCENCNSSFSTANDFIESENNDLIKQGLLLHEQAIKQNEQILKNQKYLIKSDASASLRKTVDELNEWYESPAGKARSRRKRIENKIGIIIIIIVYVVLLFIMFGLKYAVNLDIEYEEKIETGVITYSLADTLYWIFIMFLPLIIASVVTTIVCLTFGFEGKPNLIALAISYTIMVIASYTIWVSFSSIFEQIVAVIIFTIASMICIIPGVIVFKIRGY